MNEFTYLKEGLEKISVFLDDEILKKLLEYKRIVLKENELFNLTSITDDREFIELHLIDSLSVLPLIKDASDMIDVGTGAGFPGMALKIAADELQITLLDSLKKRVDFLSRAAEELALEGINYLHARAEDAARNPLYREKFDVAVSRAVAHLSPLCEICVPFVKLKGNFIAMKGKNIQDELNESGKCHEILGCEKPSQIYLELPYTQAQRNLLIYPKEKSTPKQYPRNPKQIQSKKLS